MSKFDERQTYENLFYAGGSPRVPINKLGIKKWLELDEAEATIINLKLQKGLPDKARELSFSGIKAMHEYLFNDIYEWAGSPRSYTTGRGSIPFAKPEYIENELNKLFEKLESENFLKNLSLEKFSERSAHYVNEINAIHPFIEGNGRIQRLFLIELSEQAGHKINFDKADITKSEWYKASEEGFYSSNEPMEKLILKALSADLIEKKHNVKQEFKRNLSAVRNEQNEKLKTTKTDNKIKL